MLEEILKMCESKEVQVQQDIHSGKPSYFTGILRSAGVPFDTCRWCVKDKNMIIGFSPQDVLDISLKVSKLHNVEGSIHIFLRRTSEM